MTYPRVQMRDTPRLVRLQNVPVDYPATWQVKDAKTLCCLAGFGTERAAREYMRMQGMQQVGD